MKMKFLLIVCLPTKRQNINCVFVIIVTSFLIGLRYRMKIQTAFLNKPSR